MKILADENVPGAAVEMLRSAGHDVAWVSEVGSGAADTRPPFASQPRTIGSSRPHRHRANFDLTCLPATNGTPLVTSGRFSV